MQTENVALRGAQAGPAGALGGGNPALWPTGVRGGAGGVGSGDSSLAPPSSAPLRRDRQAFSMYEPGMAAPKALGPALDSLSSHLQPLSSSVSVSGSPDPWTLTCLTSVLTVSLPVSFCLGSLPLLPGQLMLTPVFLCLWLINTAHCSLLPPHGHTSAQSALPLLEITSDVCYLKRKKAVRSWSGAWTAFFGNWRNVVYPFFRNWPMVSLPSEAMANMPREAVSRWACLVLNCWLS